MSSSNFRPLAKGVDFDDNLMWVELIDGRKLGIPLAYFPRLSGAPLSKRRKFVISGGGTGLHWDELDEDISVRGLLLGVGDLTVKEKTAA